MTETKADSISQHPLKSTWRLWYIPSVPYEVVQKKFNGDYNAAIKDSTKDICALTTVEEMWSAFNVMPPPAVLPNGDTITVMREDKKPEFEDFPGGGRLLIQEVPEMSDKLVERVIIAVLGQQTEVAMRENAAKTDKDAPPATLCSAIRVARRKRKMEDNVRVEVWITDKAHGKAMADYFTQILIEDKVEVKYEDF